MPAQKPGRSETVVRTPPEFLTAVKAFLGIGEFRIDLAASPNNAVATDYFTKEVNALAMPWKFPGWAWLNPPYDDIAPWAERAMYWGLTHGTKIAMLIPASVGSNWWRDFVHEQARINFLNGRLTFLYADGNRHKGPYPKDLALVLYGVGFQEEGCYSVWDWRRQAA